MRQIETEEMLAPAAAASRLGVSVDTLRRWVAAGRLTDHRTAGGHRRIDPTELDALMEPVGRRMAAREAPGQPTPGRGGVVGYARAHPGAPANTELYQQRERLKTYGCDEIIVEVASALSDQRRGLSELLQWVIAGEVREVVVTSIDRLAWFGTGFVNVALTASGARLTILDPSTTSAARHDELLNDLKTAQRTFTDRLWGTTTARHQELDELLTRLTTTTEPQSL